VSRIIGCAEVSRWTETDCLSYAIEVSMSHTTSVINSPKTLKKLGDHSIIIIITLIIIFSLIIIDKPQ